VLINFFELRNSASCHLRASGDPDEIDQDWIPDLFASQRATTNRNPVFLILLYIEDEAPAFAGMTRGDRNDRKIKTSLVIQNKSKKYDQ